MRRRAKRMLLASLKLAAALGVIAYVLSSGRVDLREIAVGADWRWIAAAWALLLAIPLIGWLRWWSIVRAVGLDLGLYAAFRIQMIGMFFNAFLFGVTGGDLFKAYYIAAGAGRERKAAAVTTVIVDRVVGIVGLLLLTGCCLAAAWSEIVTNPLLMGIAIAFAAVYGGAIVVMVLLLMPRLRASRRRWLDTRAACAGLAGRIARAVNEMDEALQAAVKRPLTSLACLAASVLAHVATSTSFYFFARALGVESIPYYKYLILAPLALGVTALPVFPAGGAGFGEAFASVVFSSAGGVARSVGGNVLLLWRAGLFLTGPVGLVYFVLARKEVRRARAEAEEAVDGPDTG